MVEGSLENIQNTFFDALMKDIKDVQGIDCVYFLDGTGQVIREKQFTDTDSYVDQLKDIISENPFSNSISTDIYGTAFKTCTILNERGLIIISKVSDAPNLYMVVTGGEKEPVDLINLLKLVRESLQKLQNIEPLV